MSNTPSEEAHAEYDTEDALRHAREFVALVSLISNAFAAVAFAETDLGGAEDKLEAYAYEALKRLAQDAFMDLGAVQDGVTFKDAHSATTKAAIEGALNAAQLHVLPNADKTAAPRKRKAGAR